MSVKRTRCGAVQNSDAEQQQRVMTEHPLGWRMFKQNDLFRSDRERYDYNACVGDNGGPYDLYDYADGSRPGLKIWPRFLQGQSLNGASFTAIEQLQQHIDAFITAYNETAEPFVWTKKKVHQRRSKIAASLNSNSRY